MIDVLGPGVEDMLIRKELEIANFEDHVKRVPSTSFF
jgi:hypothetical protein